MGKRNRFKEAKRQGAQHALSAVLRAHSQRHNRVDTVGAYGEFNPVYRKRIEPYCGQALRAPETWYCRIKSRDEDKRFIDLVRHTFARYRIPAHLEHAWIVDIDDDFVDQVAAPVPRAGRSWQRPDLRAWSIVVAQGGSLYRSAAHPFMSKRETHHFLNAPDEVTGARQAFWYAFAHAETDHRQVALAVSRSKLTAFSAASSFWKDVARYLARNPTSVQQMNDLIDFLLAAKQEDEAFSLKGRSLAALRRRMEEWHRALRKQQQVCGGAWPGRSIPDAEYRTGGDHKRAIWRFRQIKTGNDLFREGQRMHHCVASYKRLCLDGSISIWSLRCEYPIGSINKGVTMEVREDGAIVQCRGFANRLPYGNEVVIAKRWAREYGLTWQALEGA
jgi:PcfJ-like protein